jgi:hypothetical protein
MTLKESNNKKQFKDTIDHELGALVMATTSSLSKYYAHKSLSIQFISTLSAVKQSHPKVSNPHNHHQEQQQHRPSAVVNNLASMSGTNQQSSSSSSVAKSMPTVPAWYRWCCCCSSLPSASNQSLKTSVVEVHSVSVSPERSLLSTDEKLVLFVDADPDQCVDMYQAAFRFWQSISSKKGHYHGDNCSAHGCSMLAVAFNTTEKCFQHRVEVERSIVTNGKVDSVSLHLLVVKNILALFEWQSNDKIDSVAVDRIRDLCLFVQWCCIQNISIPSCAEGAKIKI